MKKINLIPLVLVVFAISWLGVLPGLLIAYGVDIPPGLKQLDILMTLGPLIGAVLFIYKVQGKAGLKHFFGRLFRFRITPAVLALTILLPIVISLLGALIGLSVSDTSWPEAFRPAGILMNGLVIFLVYLIINTEELVWRGIVFDQLLDRYRYVKACLVLIPIWWLFHLPLFLYPNGHPAGYGLIVFSGFVIALTFILGWIYVRTSRSLFYVHIHHQLFNGFGQAFPLFPVFIGGNQMPVWTFCILLLFTAGMLWIQYRKNPVVP